MTVTLHCHRPNPDPWHLRRAMLPPMQVWWESDDLPLGVLLTENRFLMDFDTLRRPALIEGVGIGAGITMTIDPEDRP